MSHYEEIILFNEDYLTSLLSDINKAKKSIDIEVYIFEEDAVGKKVTHALCEAASRGVNIRISVDGFGSMNWGGEVAKRLIDAGIKVKVFHPLPWNIAHWGMRKPGLKFILTKITKLFSNINSRNHRKDCLIDHKILYIGSANISVHLKDTSDEKCWRETNVKLLGFNTEEVQYAFDKAWGGIPLRKRFQHTFIKKPSESIVHLNYSWRHRRRLYKSLLQRINHCKKRIWVTNAYFIPDNRLLKVLIKASKKGIDVRILLPGKSDVFFVSFASATFYSALLNNGVLIYEYLPAILHSKILILDDWYLIGSSNLNYRSFKHDLEIDVELQSDKAKKIIEKQFLLDLEQSHQLKKEDVQRQSIIKKLAGKFVLLMRNYI